MAPPSFESIDWETDAQYLSWRSRIETSGDVDELKLRRRWYKRTHDPDFDVDGGGDGGGARQRRAPAPAPATPTPAPSAPPPPRPRPATNHTPPTARTAARFVVLALFPLALVLTPALAALVAALLLPTLARLAPFLHETGSYAYSGCLAAAFVAQLLAVRDKHGAPPLSGGGAALRGWAARALDAGVAGDASLVAWALLFFIHRTAVRCGLALVPLAVAAAGGGGGVSLLGGVSLPPRGLVAWGSSAKPLGAGLATGAQLAAWGHVATALYLTFARFPLALAAGPAGSARATALLAYYCWTLLRARRSASDADAAAQREAWRLAGAWARPRIVERFGGDGQGSSVARAYAFVRDKWWDAAVGVAGAGGAGAAAARGR